MPRIVASLDRLNGVTNVTKLDMTRGYWQVPIASSGVGLTGFVTSHGHYQWRHMPCGLRNALATFIRLVAKIFKELEDFVKLILTISCFLADQGKLTYLSCNKSLPEYI